MCGIAGISGRPQAEPLKAMVASMHHRGPNDHGVFLDDAVGLGMARLSIIDLSPAGHQPMSNPEGSIWMVYNGETYNFQQERALLEAQGFTFKSHTDSEVVLKLYERYGDDFLLRMRGMFALAIYDKRGGPGRERLLLARDHLGIKPLLYSQIPGGLVFASEMKALLASGRIAAQIDPESLRLLMTFGSINQPRTAIQGVSMLLPGHRLIADRDGVRIQRYWGLSTQRHPDFQSLGHEGLVERMAEALEESVRLQMVSDVPLGAFLSGGVDSSLLVAMMSKISGSPIRTFSVGYRDEGQHFDETEDAAKIAAFIGTEHSRVLITGQDAADQILRLASALDQPSVDGANAYFVSAAARKGVSVAISGTGGDEIFAGYPWFIQMVAAMQEDKKHLLRTAARSMLAQTARTEWLDRMVIHRGGSRLQHLRNTDFVSRFASKYQIFGVVGAARVLSRDMRGRSQIGRSLAADMALADELRTAGPVERVSALCLRGYLQNQLLRDIDATSMAHSLEVRVPFVDPIVADLGLALPASAKLGDLSKLARPETGTYEQTGAKRILVDIGLQRKLVPPGMARQPKRGFAMPFDSWMRKELRPFLEDTLSPQSIRDRGWFDPGEVAAVRSSFQSGKSGWAQPWLLMMTELWARSVLDKAAKI